MAYVMKLLTTSILLLLFGFLDPDRYWVCLYYAALYSLVYVTYLIFCNYRTKKKRLDIITNIIPCSCEAISLVLLASMCAFGLPQNMIYVVLPELISLSITTLKDSVEVASQDGENSLLTLRLLQKVGIFIIITAGALHFENYIDWEWRVVLWPIWVSLSFSAIFIVVLWPIILLKICKQIIHKKHGWHEIRSLTWIGINVTSFTIISVYILVFINNLMETGFRSNEASILFAFVIFSTSILILYSICNRKELMYSN